MLHSKESEYTASLQLCNRDYRENGWIIASLTVELFNLELRSSQIILLTQHLGRVIGI